MLFSRKLEELQRKIVYMEKSILATQKTSYPSLAKRLEQRLLAVDHFKNELEEIRESLNLYQATSSPADTLHQIYSRLHTLTYNVNWLLQMELPAYLSQSVDDYFVSSARSGQKFA